MVSLNVEAHLSLKMHVSIFWVLSLCLFSWVGLVRFCSFSRTKKFRFYCFRRNPDFAVQKLQKVLLLLTYLDIQVIFSVTIGMTSDIMVSIFSFLLVEDYDKIAIFFFCWNPDYRKVPKSAVNFDISPHSNFYFFTTTCFTPRRKVWVNKFLLEEALPKISFFLCVRIMAGWKCRKY